MKPFSMTLMTVCLVCVSLPLATGGRARAGEPPPNEWVKATEGGAGRCCGAVLVPIEDGRKMLLLGGEPGTGASIRALDPRQTTWSDFATAKPEARRGIHPYYQTAFDPKTKKLYCLSYPGLLYTFDVVARKWAGPETVAALEGLSWHAVAIDPAGRKLVVLGADKRPGNLGWSRTAVLDLDTGKWATLPLPPAPVVRRHRALVAATEAAIDVAGRIRLAWYRDPTGRGTDAERKALIERFKDARRQTGFMELTGDVESICALLAGGRTLEALRATRLLHRKLDEAAHMQYPVPPSRRNSPLVFDARNKVFVVFGGDHEDYLLNDTWVLDLSKRAWRRMGPDLAPSPRAGHALAYLPDSGRVALYEGYVQTNSPDYGTGTWRPLEPRQLWVYDAAADRWDLLGAWADRKGEARVPPPACEFYGYHAQYFNPPALAVTADGRIALVVPESRWRKYKSTTWLLRPDIAKADAAGRAKLGRKPGQRLYRTGRFLAAYCEVPDAPKDAGLSSLPANRWVKLPPVPRNVAYGRRQRDWGTAVWDAANEQILLWGGGHCVGSASSVIHYSPVSNRMVEGFDADEPYGRNGNGGFDSSLLNRPWSGVHSYNTYAYDPPTGLMISARGYCYDPVRMDWLRRQRAQRPFKYIWSATVLEATPHGVVAWGTDARKDRQGLWLHDEDAGWVDLKPVGKLYKPYCDSEGMTYDSKRDRLILGWGGGYNKAGDASLTTFDFRTRKIEKLTPAGAELGLIRNTREMAYVEGADWVAFAEPYFRGDRERARHYLRIYDCAKDRYFLLDAGDGPSRQFKVHGQGWCRDAKRKLLYVITIKGDVWALRFDPSAAKLLDAPPELSSARPANPLDREWAENHLPHAHRGGILNLAKFSPMECRP